MTPRAPHKGFTLIELLIVVAILSIFSAGSLAVIMAPPEEHAFAGIEQAQQAGLDTAFAALVADSRAAQGASYDEADSIIRFTAPAGDTIYHVDEAGLLRRSAGLPPGGAAAGGVALLEGVTAFGVAPLPGSPCAGWRIEIAAGESRLGRDVATRRVMDLAVPCGEVTP